MPLPRPVPLLALALLGGLAGALTLPARDARADCVQAGSDVTCTAADTDGFVGAGNDLTVTVETGATVDDGVADANAITLGDANAVTIEAGATITADGDGSHGLAIGNDNNDDDLDGDGVSNAGAITVTGNNAGAISGGTGNDVTNTGTLSAGDATMTPTTGAFGIGLGADANVSNEAGAAIIAVGDGTTGISVGDGSTVDNAGSITSGVVGSMGGSLGVDAGDDSVITNLVGGSITVGGEDPGNDVIGVRMGADTAAANSDVDLRNEGTIIVNGGEQSAYGVIVGAGNTVENAPNAVIQATGNQPDDMDMFSGAPVVGIQLGADTNFTNEGIVQVIGDGAVAIDSVGGAGSVTNITILPTGLIATQDGADPFDLMTTFDALAIRGGDGVENVDLRGSVNGGIELGAGNDTLTVFTGIGFSDVAGGADTDALILDGGGSSILNLDLVSEFESIDIDAMVTDMDTMQDFFGFWELQGTLPDSLPGGMTLSNGTLVVRDTVTFDSATGFTTSPGTTFQVLAAPGGPNGNLVVTGGGDIDLTALDDTLTFTQLAPLTSSTTLTILEAQGGGGVMGVFENEPVDTPLLDFQVNYLASSVELGIIRNSYASVAGTPNQEAAGNYLDALLAGGGNGPGIDALLVLLDSLDAAQLAAAYDGLHPEAYDTHTGQVAALGRAFAEAAIEPRLDCKPAFFGLDPGPLRDVPCGDFTAWMKLLFSESKREPGSDFFDSDASRQAIAGGFDWRLNRWIVLTAYAGIGSVDIDVDDVGSGDIQSLEFGAAVQARLGPARLRATLGYGRGEHEQDRTYSLGTFGELTTQGEFDSNRVQSLVEFGWLFEWLDFQIEPLARLDVTWIQEDAFGESDFVRGIPGLNLNGAEIEVEERENVLVGTQFGARLRYRHHQSAYSDDVWPYTQGTWTPEISASWRSLWTGADREIDARLSAAGPGAGSFTAEAEDSEQGVDVGAKVTFQPHGSGGSFSFGYDGFFGDKGTDHRFGLALEVYF